SGKPFSVTEKDFLLYRKLGVPAPSLCPEERQRRRLTFRNFRNLSYRPCDGTGRKILSMYGPTAPFPVFEQAYWWSDSWDPRSFEQAFDFKRSFFDQYRDFSATVPRFNIANVKSENCQFSNVTNDSKDCYLIFGCIRSEGCLYGHIVWDCTNCLDSLYL